METREPGKNLAAITSVRRTECTGWDHIVKWEVSVEIFLQVASSFCKPENGIELPMNFYNQFPEPPSPHSSLPWLNTSFNFQLKPVYDLSLGILLVL